MSYQEKPSLKECVDAVCGNILMHEGVGHEDGGNSGRYPWGSGDNPYQHQPHALITFDEKMRKLGLSEREIIDAWNGEHVDDKNLQFTTTQYRTALSVYKSRHKQELQKSAQYLHDVEHKGPTEIAKILGLPNESSARSLLEKQHQDNVNKADATADILKKRLEETGGYLMVGKGTEHELGITKNKLDNALFILEQDGYPHYDRRIDQVTDPKSANKTTIRLLCPPGTKYKDVYAPDALSKINSFMGYESKNDGKTYEVKQSFQYPTSLDSKRLYIKYGDDEDSGTPRDGLIEIRPGVEDLSLGNNRYAQVRIMVDNTHYLKGMAVYSDNVPEGYDIVFNSNKSRSKGIYGSLKPLKTLPNSDEIDKENPFGSLIKLGDDKTTLGNNGGQSYYIDSKTGEQKLSLINKTRDEGDWDEWRDALPSQFLAKQPQKLINNQLSLTIKDKQNQYKDILTINNPTVKKKMLLDFADECETDAVDLKAMALPGQKWNVIIPIPSMPDNEVYAPGYQDGTTVALVRYPHEGIFQIPILTVNNKRKEGQKVIGKDTMDAVGINATVAQTLSGADFDGDTVMLIPCNSSSSKIKINSKPIEHYEGLKNFEPSDWYGQDEDSPKVDANGVKHYYQNGKEYTLITEDQKQREMGVASNLIMDMTLQDATEAELARATRYSMTVIDAVKHELNIKQCYVDNDIEQLKRKYQVNFNEDGSIHYGGASTLITKAGSETSKPKTQGTPHIDEKWDPTQNKWVPTGKQEGKLYWKPSDNLYYPKGSYDKENHTRTLKTVDGQTITYDTSNTDDYNKYAPVQSTDPKTGKVTFYSKDGKLQYVTEYSKTKSTKMKETDDAFTLISSTRTKQEVAYGEYANALKSMANEARKEYMQTPEVSYNPEAKAKYKTEYDSLMNQLKISEKNSPREQQAQVIANMVVQAKKEEAFQEGIKLTSKELGKIQQKAITQARLDVGASRYSINVSEKEWEAIQEGAIGSSNLSKILLKADPAQIREYALPHNSKGLSQGQIARIRNLNSNNYTVAQIASIVGVSPSTIYNYLNQ